MENIKKVFFCDWGIAKLKPKVEYTIIVHYATDNYICKIQTLKTVCIYFHLEHTLRRQPFTPAEGSYVR